MIELKGKEKIELFPNHVGKSQVVSVCVQAYMHENFIHQCLDSIIEQETNFDFEILIGEDNSSDRTREICMEYATKYPNKIRLFLHDRSNVIYINDKPTGRYNFLFNLKEANGKYIAFCEGDDYWIDKQKLQKQFDLLEKNNKMSSCTHNVYQVFSKNDYSFSEKKIYCQLNFKKLYLEDLLANRYSLFHTSSFMFRTELLSFPNLLMEAISGDMTIFNIIAQHGAIGVIPEFMSVYRDHSGGITKTQEHMQYLAKNKIHILQLFDKYFDYKYTKVIKKTIRAYEINSPVRLSLAFRIKMKIKHNFS